MKSRPILFSAPMVRAILAGNKTQTRRILKGQPPDDWDPSVGWYCPTKIAHDGEEYPGAEAFGASDAYFGIKSPYGAPGDELWVKETWAATAQWDGIKPTDIPDTTPIYYAADDHMREWQFKRRPSLFMPRWASRITLTVEDVRVERLQDISEEDAIAEGVEKFEFLHVGKYMASDWRHYGDDKTGCRNAAESFRTLWKSINGPESWAANPWVWVIEFRRVEP